MKSNEEIRILFEKEICGEISEKEKAHLNSILNSDPQIKEEYELWKRIDDSIRKKDTINLRNKLKSIMADSQEKTQPVSRIKRSISKKWYAIAASVVILISVGIGLYVSNIDKNETYAMNFTESPYLESSIVQTRSDDIVVITPEQSDTYNIHENIIFNLEIPDSDPVKLLIFNNKETIIFETKLDMTPFVFNQSLTPGLYYWRIETEDDILYSNRFFIRK